MNRVERWLGKKFNPHGLVSSESVSPHGQPFPYCSVTGKWRTYRDGSVEFELTPAGKEFLKWGAKMAWLRGESGTEGAWSKPD